MLQCFSFTVCIHALDCVEPVLGNALVLHSVSFRPKEQHVGNDVITVLWHLPRPQTSQVAQRLDAISVDTITLSLHRHIEHQGQRTSVSQLWPCT